ncbi:hypothetical protein ANOBCDAF_02420 [Pleomorphomonas sp. T1.2MG-36]|uniref:hypothetical protein n=1 Tax=Pleomorphomonas sp. T1.2MG-36 TaxID=3041167 RepID=UPI002477C8E9|nr:hypothetical protein [Pleomorphomonas sp. T1.2MG-36]CAI9411230.1 hypothetical protein ANOBCDAF_02420 [Pleomorphomonas sp. T1.2MG-36]
MIRRALTFIAHRLIFMALLLLALNVFSQRSGYGTPKEAMRVLAGIAKALDTLSSSFR